MRDASTVHNLVKSCNVNGILQIHPLSGDIDKYLLTDRKYTTQCYGASKYLFQSITFQQNSDLHEILDASVWYQNLEKSGKMWG